MTKPALSIVIPAFNEEVRLMKTLQEISHFLQANRRPFELIVVDDGSTDRTGQIARQFSEQGALAVQVLANQGNRGKGYSVRRGMLAATSPVSLLTDADLSTPISELDKLEVFLQEKGKDIVIGSRDVEGSQILNPQSPFRSGGGKLFNRLARLILGLPFADTQCGFKLFRMQTCRDIFRVQQIHRFSFDAEILFVASQWGLDIEEVPVVWSHVEGSKVTFYPDALVAALDLFRIRWNHLKRYYSPSPVQRIEEKS